MAELIITVPAFADNRKRVRHYFGTRHFSRSGSAALKRRRHARQSPQHGGRIQRAVEDHTRHMRASARSHLVVSVRQVHGTDVLVIDELPRADKSITGTWDALVTNQRGVELTVSTADCVPILIYDPDRAVIAAVHAGWRGAVGGILAKTVGTMHRVFGSAARSLQVGIGPSVGPCCYEVDEPVISRLRTGFPGWRTVIEEAGSGKAMLDLRKLVRGQAHMSGVDPEAIWTVGACTVCHPELFYSYRREGVVNSTMISGIVLK